MGLGTHLKALFVFGPIVGLLTLGLIIALRSGAGNLSSPEGREQFVSNLSTLVVRIVGFGVGLLALHRMIGIPLEPLW
jgi:hypothetical protein